MKKNITIYVQGLNYLSSKNSFLQQILDLFYFLTNTKATNKVEQPDWLTKENTNSLEIKVMAWKATLNPFVILEAIKQLQKEIILYRDEYNIIVVGTSMGGLIATEALSIFSSKEVSHLILVGSVNRKRYVELNGIRVLNIYSTADTLAKLGIGILAPVKGSQELEGKNIVNIPLDKIRHDQLFEDLRISSGVYSDKTIGQAVREYITHER